MKTLALPLLLIMRAALPVHAAAQGALAQPADTLTLGRALTLALERSPLLASAGAAADAARALGDEVASGRLPTVAASMSVTRFEEPMVVAPLHSLELRTLPDFDRTLAQGRLTASWTVFDAGARRALTAAASARSAEADARLGQARMDVYLEVVETYLRVEGARDAVLAQRAREEELESERARAADFLDQGAAPRLELLRAEAELAEARATAVGVDARVSAAESDLARLMGLPVAAVAGAFLAPVRATPARAGEPSPNAPALAAARARTAASEAMADAARTPRLPRIQGTGGFVEYGSAGGGFTGEWQLGIQMDYAIFSGGARSARIQSALADARRATAEEAAVADQTARAIDAATAALAEAGARADALATAVGTFEELVRVQALAVQEGAGVQADYLRALAGLGAARVGLADARRAVVLNHARLARAQGRLDLDWIRGNLEGVR